MKIVTISFYTGFVRMNTETKEKSRNMFTEEHLKEMQGKRLKTAFELINDWNRCSAQIQKGKWLYFLVD